MPSRIAKPFYMQDALTAGRALLGKTLVTRFNGCMTAGTITETEAYNGTADRASHAYMGKRTNRTEIMFLEGGVAYVYLCYGIHSLFNVVLDEKDNPQAVLIRAIRPVAGLAHMLKRRCMPAAGKNFTVGPGKVAQAMGIHYAHSGTSLLGNRIWIEEAPPAKEARVTVTRRIGVDYAGPDALLPYRFILEN